jgi:hypothetical protein
MDDLHDTRRAERGHGRSWLCTLFGLASLCCAGCGNGDVDRLARVWHRIGCRAKEWSGGAHQKLSSGWSALQTQVNSPAVLRERVLARLQLDKGLTNTSIEVEVSGAIVTLRGTTPDQASRQKAVELAQGTVGVEQVVDELEAKE